MKVHAVLAAAIVLTLTPMLQADDTIRIGREIKTTVGTVTSLDVGDVACYITFNDDRGIEFQELAEFEICDMDGLIGKRVALTYGTGEVMADECEGDPECTETRNVALVREVQVIARKPAPRPAPAPAPVAPPPPAKRTGQASLCSAGEDTIFACQIGAKVVSVCTSRDASSDDGWMQYRFGKPASREPLEQVLPAGRTVPSFAATGENVSFSGGGGNWLRFHGGIYSYVVYSAIGRWGPNGETRVKEGLVVERSGKVVTNLPCTGLLISELGPDWYEEFEVETRNESFRFP
ncbi:MAG: hypothetical protein ABI779_10950 [Acidobacteriota bacterium]